MPLPRPTWAEGPLPDLQPSHWPQTTAQPTLGTLMVPEGTLSPQCSPSHRLPVWPWCCHQDAQHRGRSSVFASTSVGPLVVMGPAAPTAGGNYGVSMSTPGPTRSQAPRASALEMDMGRLTALLLIPFGPCDRGSPWLQHGCSRRRTQHPSAWRHCWSHLKPHHLEPPVHSTGGGVTAEYYTIPTIGGAVFTLAISAPAAAWT